MAADTSILTTDFAAEFPASEADWRKAAEAALKGRPLDKVLRAGTIDGVAFEAIATRREAKPIAGRPAGARWTAMTRIDLADPAVANAQALEDLNNGASGLSLVFADGAGQGGLVADTVERLDATLDKVLLDLAPIHLDAPAFRGRPAAALFAAAVERRGDDPATIDVLFGVEPIRSFAESGILPAPIELLAGGAADMLATLRARGFASPVFMADQRLAHDAGASEAQELAGALATALELVRRISDAGADPAAVLDATALAFSADADQFATIAKLRAARLVFAALRRELGFDERPVRIHVETSRRMLAQNDFQTNMVRTTIAAFAAGVGGADSVVALPHSLPLGAVDADARRIARNTQAIVLDESNAYRVADPAAGAGAIEALTDALAEKAWALFQEIEREGGMLDALRAGAWQARIKATRDARAAGVAKRAIPIVGVSQFPKADETRPAPVAATTPEVSTGKGRPIATGFAGTIEALLDGAALADISIVLVEGEGHETCEKLRPARVAEAFETLRAANEARDPRPAAMLALVGPIARHGARAGFMRNLLEAGGIRVVDGPVEVEASEVAMRYSASGASLAVLCGADGDYAEGASAIAEALKGAGATVWLAGRPKEGVEALEQAGVSRVVVAGDDAIAVLTAASALQGGA